MKFYDKELKQDAFEEAVRRYPECEKGLVFFLAATTPPVHPTPEDIEWVNNIIDNG